MRRLPVVLLALTACRFDPSGVAGDDDGDDVPTIDAARPDASGPDASPIDSGAPDAEVPDAMPDLDQDDDTILDAVDNCVVIPNTDQHDEDVDTVGDACDNCPHLANTNQANTTEPSAEADTVGDVCDPHPTTADVIALFDPFTGTGAPTGWTAIGGTWTKGNDEVSQSVAAGVAYLYRPLVSAWTDMVGESSIDVDMVAASTGGGGGPVYRSIGSIVFFTPGAQTGTGSLCIVLDDLEDNFDAVLFEARHADNGGTSSTQNSGELGAGLATGQNYVIRASANGTTTTCTLVRTVPVTLASTDSTFTSGTLALRTNGVAASFRYAVVITPLP